MKTVLCLVVFALSISMVHAQMGGMHFSTPAPAFHPAPAVHPNVNHAPTNHVHVDHHNAAPVHPAANPAPVTTIPPSNTTEPKKKKRRKKNADAASEPKPDQPKE